MILLDGVEVLDLNGLDLSSVERVEVVKGSSGRNVIWCAGSKWSDPGIHEERIKKQKTYNQFI